MDLSHQAYAKSEQSNKHSHPILSSWPYTSKIREKNFPTLLYS